MEEPVIHVQCGQPIRAVKRITHNDHFNEAMFEIDEKGEYHQISLSGWDTSLQTKYFHPMCGQQINHRSLEKLKERLGIA